MSFYLESNNKKDCFNCSACCTVCPKDCIKMVYNEKDGYYYPKKDIKECINCGLCEKVCINLNNKNLQQNIKKAYILKNKDDKVRLKSSSGGISDILMKYVIENNGVVYGAKYSDDMEVIHTRAETVLECEKFKTSKYVKSNLKETFKEIKKDLNDNKLILFTGTPCQVAGLKSILTEKQLRKVILCEIMCDSTASPLLFKKFINYLEKKYNSRIVNFNFRGKDEKTKIKIGIVYLENGRVIKLPANKINPYSDYMQIFGCGYSAPYSCMNCKFEHTNERVSDFTIGDYWGRKEIIPDDNKGLSFILINSMKGIELFDNYIKNKVICEEVDIIEALDRNHIKNKSVILKKDEFYDDLPLMDFYNLKKKYVSKYRLRTFVGKMIPKELKDKVKRILIGHNGDFNGK